MANLAKPATTVIPIDLASTSIAKVQTTDRVINQLQDNISQPLGSLVANPITQGALLQKVSLLSGDNIVVHGLGRKMLGWFTTRIRANTVSLYDTNDTITNPNTSLYLYLNASANTTVDLYVF